MTPADHAALSAQLARVLGWPVVEVIEVTDYEGVFVAETCRVKCKGDKFTRVFDYLDPSVAMGVLGWLIREHGAEAWMYEGVFVVGTMDSVSKADTLPEAIARAAIAVGGGE